jgi:hypothetical protein
VFLDILLFLGDRDEVQYELLGKNATVIEPCIRKTLIPEALDRIRKCVDLRVLSEVSQLGTLIEEDT